VSAPCGKFVCYCHWYCFLEKKNISKEGIAVIVYFEYQFDALKSIFFVLQKQFMAGNNKLFFIICRSKKRFIFTAKPIYCCRTKYITVCWKKNQVIIPLTLLPVYDEQMKAACGPNNQSPAGLAPDVVAQFASGELLRSDYRPGLDAIASGDDFGDGSLGGADLSQCQASSSFNDYPPECYPTCACVVWEGHSVPLDQAVGDASLVVETSEFGSAANICNSTDPNTRCLVAPDQFYEGFQTFLWGDTRLTAILSGANEFGTDDEGHLTYASQGIYLQGLRETQDYETCITDVRDLMEKYNEIDGVDVYPSGVSFVFWEQYIHLYSHIGVAVGGALAIVLVITGAMFMNPMASVVFMLTLVCTLVQVLGIIAAAGLKVATLLSFLTFFFFLPSPPSFFPSLPALPSLPSFTTFLPSLSCFVNFLPSLPSFFVTLPSLPSLPSSFLPISLLSV
jgi:hypothetical protein